MRIRVGGVPEHFNLPWHLGLEQGAFARAGLEIDFIEYPTGTGAMCQDLRAGKLDLAVALTEGLLMDIARYGQIALLAPYVLSPLRWGIHVGASTTLNDVAELQEQVFAISRHGSGSHLMALLWGREQGWDPRTMSFATAGGLDQLTHCVGEGLAKAFLWEVFTTLPKVRAGQLRCLAEFPTPWPCFMVAAHCEVLAQRREELDTLLTVLYDLTARCMQQSEITIVEVARRYDLSLSDAESWFRDLRWATGPELPRAELAQAMQVLKELGLVSPAAAC
ncbi:MAG: ABC transporter substrate-binding protein [Candidatus Melainabacteria bacterium HGW-Melainabacteria-1]|nr:MAG: ABC transporter substrate-binding protein [Candidatus Melainabacteria bacterium HGW-Melainabacteria-1]